MRSCRYHTECLVAYLLADRDPLMRLEHLGSCFLSSSALSLGEFAHLFCLLWMIIGSDAYSRSRT